MIQGTDLPKIQGTDLSMIQGTDLPILRITRRAVSDLQPAHFITNAFNLSHWLFGSIRPEALFHIIIITVSCTGNCPFRAPVTIQPSACPFAVFCGRKCMLVIVLIGHVILMASHKQALRIVPSQVHYHASIIRRVESFHQMIRLFIDGQQRRNRIRFRLCCFHMGCP